jgi:hypothetical protein
MWIAIIYLLIGIKYYLLYKSERGLTDRFDKKLASLCLVWPLWVITICIKEIKRTIRK